MVHHDLQPSSTTDTGMSKGKNDVQEWNRPIAETLVLKLRIHGSEESDFIEVELSSLTYQALLEACAEELEVGVSDITKIRKLPNILVRKDRDVQRLSNGQELEVVC
jgi:hypothetical protein